MTPQNFPLAHNGGGLFLLILGVALVAVWSISDVPKGEDPRRTAQLAGPRALVRAVTLAAFVLFFLTVLGFTVAL